MYELPEMKGLALAPPNGNFWRSQCIFALCWQQSRSQGLKKHVET